MQPRWPARILFVITDLDMGGAEKCVVQLATRLDRSRWSPAVCCLTPAGTLADELRTRDVPVHSLDARRLWAAPAAVARLTRHIWRVRPDIVHTFLFHANVLGRTAARAAGVGRVVSSVRVAERRFRHHLILETLTCRLARRIICVSEAVARFTRSRAHVPASRLVVVPNGVETGVAPSDVASRRGHGRPDGAVTTLFAGRLDPQKGVDVLIRALALAVVQVPNLNLQIAGAGAELTNLQALASQLGVERHVQFLGFRRDLQQLMKAADFLVLPSRWEGMPNVVLEAMADGLPVVATRTEGTTEIVRHDENGALVPIDDPAALAREMIRVARDPALRAAWSARGREHVRREFSVNTMIDRHVQIYEALLANRA